MACGRPVVATDVGDVRRYIRSGENGWLLPPDRPEDWPACLEQVGRTPAEVLQRMAAAARETVVRMRMDVDTMVDRHRALYKKLLSSCR